MEKHARRDIRISEQLVERILNFIPVVDAVMGEKYDFDECAELVLSRGVDSMVEDLLGNVSPDVLLQFFEQLGAKHPAEVYAFIANTIRDGGAAQAAEELKGKIGF